MPSPAAEAPGRGLLPFHTISSSTLIDRQVICLYTFGVTDDSEKVIYVSKSKIVLGGIILAVVLAGSAGVGSHFSSEDAPRNTAPEDICEEYGFKTSDEPGTVTIEKGETVSGKATKPLADQLGISMTVAKDMIADANPKAYNLDEVAEGAVINVPNCAAKESRG